MKGLTELNVFRGTYKEVQAKETRDMTIYLAWDTQEIFIGNSLGTKVKYGSGQNLDKGLKAYFATFKDELYKEVKNYSVLQVEDRVREVLDEIRDTYDTAKQELSSHKEALSADLESKLSILNERLDNIVLEYNNIINEVSITLNKKIDESVSELSASITEAKNDYTDKISKLESTVRDDIGKTVENLELNIQDNYYNKDSMSQRYYTKTEIDKELAGIVYGEDISLQLDGYVRTDNFEDYKDETSRTISKNLSDSKVYTDEKFESVKTTVNKLIGNAPEAYDTLKEIADYISSDQTAASEMLASIQRTSENIASISEDLEDNYYNKGEIDKKITDAVTGGQVDLSNYYTKSETRSEIDKEITIEATVRDNAIKAVNAKFDNYYTRTEVDNKISSGGGGNLSEYATKTFVNSQIDNVRNELNGKYATPDYVDAAVKNVTVDLTGYATETYVDNKVSNEVGSAIAGLSFSADDITFNDTSVATSLTTLSNNINTLGNTVDNKLDTTVAEKTYATKDDIKDLSFANVMYMTGDQIIEYILGLENISDFKPVFCILNSTTSDDYTVGGLYYYDPELEEIMSSATGGSFTPTEIVSTLRLSVTATDTSGADNIEEVNSQALQLAITMSADKIDAIKGDVTFKIASSSETISVENFADQKVIQRSTSIPRTSVGSYSITLSAAAKDATKKNTYTVRSGSKTYSFYKPCFIGTDESNLKKLGRNYKGTWGSSYTSGDTSGKTLYMYTTGKISSITMSGFGYSYSLEDDSYKLTVNGVECTYYKYNLGNVYSELADIVVS